MERAGDSVRVGVTTHSRCEMSAEAGAEQQQEQTHGVEKGHMHQSINAHTHVQECACREV